MMPARWWRRRHGPVIPPGAAIPALECREFTGSIPRDWRISSFTSLTANHNEELPDHDALGAPSGERNGAYQTGRYTAEAKAERRDLRAVIRELRRLTGIAAK